jgi:hypothetical protein
MRMNAKRSKILKMILFSDNGRAVLEDIHADASLKLWLATGPALRAEIIRSTSKHYCHFNLQLWAALADIYRSCGIDLWQFEASPGRGIVAAMSYLATQLREPAWPGKQIDVFDCRRSQVLLLLGHANGASAPTSLAMTHPRAERFDPHSAIRPWWRLGTARAL